MMLLGKNRVNIFNFMFILQGALMFLLLIGLYYIVDYKEIKGYLAGLLCAYLIAWLYSFVWLIPHLSKIKNKPAGKTFTYVLKEMVLYGLWGSLDNLAEGLTTRLNYFLIQHTSGYGQVGLLDSGTKMSESVWHISNSISYIEYKQVSMTTDRQQQKRITLQLLKLTACALIVVMTMICCIPEWVYTKYLLTAEFAGIRGVIIGLSPGVVALGSNRIISHFFIGSGAIKYSAYCSIIGFAILLLAGIILIPAYGVLGAAITSSIAYTGMLVFSLIVFMKMTGTMLIELIPSKADWHHLIQTSGLSFVRSFHNWK
jgi:O-antigen/teichoic acid export membrane protein